MIYVEDYIEIEEIKYKRVTKVSGQYTIWVKNIPLVEGRCSGLHLIRINPQNYHYDWYVNSITTDDDKVYLNRGKK